MDFVSVVERIGVPVAIIAIVGWAFWNILVWVAAKVVEPIAASHIALVESTKKTNEMNAETLKKVGEIFESKSTKLDVIQGHSIKILELLEKKE
jgi:hypothetical protein